MGLAGFLEGRGFSVNIPELERDIRGLEMIERMAREMFGDL